MLEKFTKIKHDFEKFAKIVSLRKWRQKFQGKVYALYTVFIDAHNPGHHLVSPYSRNLIFGTGVGMNLQSYQCSFSN